MADEVVRCDACPVLCRIRPGKVGACDRYANEGGLLVRVDPLVKCPRTGPVKAGPAAARARCCARGRGGISLWPCDADEPT